MSLSAASPRRSVSGCWIWVAVIAPAMRSDANIRVGDGCRLLSVDARQLLSVLDALRRVLAPASIVDAMRCVDPWLAIGQSCLELCSKKSLGRAIFFKKKLSGFVRAILDANTCCELRPNI